MRPSSKSEPREKICVPIVEKTTAEALRAVRQAGRVADFIELRLDYLRQPEWECLLESSPKPVIVTHRRKEEGGKFSTNAAGRFRVLREAIDLGANYVDVEMKNRRSLVRDLIEKKKTAEVILSYHDFRGTPPYRELRRLFERMVGLEADIVKIVTYARSPEDNASTLLLIPYALERKKRIVTFCMGERGRVSRVISPLIGAAWTYASLTDDRASAPGQLTVGQMRQIWKRLR
jgi:3-dehydroquinate dehydratase type I